MSSAGGGVPGGCVHPYGRLTRTAHGEFPGVDPQAVPPHRRCRTAAVRAMPHRSRATARSRAQPARARKGFDVLIRARPTRRLGAAAHYRQRAHERRLVDLAVSHQVHPSGALPLGRLPAAEIAPLYASADVFSMLLPQTGGLASRAEGFRHRLRGGPRRAVCRRWRTQWGSHEAVVDGETDSWSRRASSLPCVALARLLGDDSLQSPIGSARERGHGPSNDVLAERLLPLTRGNLARTSIPDTSHVSRSLCSRRYARVLGCLTAPAPL